MVSERCQCWVAESVFFNILGCNRVTESCVYHFDFLDVVNSLSETKDFHKSRFGARCDLLIVSGALVQLLLFSTFHHLLSLLGHNKSKMGKVAHVGDRVAIFIFIAASYTPWLVLRNYVALDPC